MGLCFGLLIVTKGRNHVHKPSSKVLPATMPETFQTSDELIQIPNLKRYHFSELKEATNDFSQDNELGPSFCGFKGRIGCEAVAVKVILKKDRRGHQNLLEKITCMGQLSHPNFVKLIGFCLEDDNWLLVYEFISNGSLNDHLRGFGVHCQPLSWKLYMKAALGAAKGLAFIHHEAGLIYEDFKPTNVLLDSSYNAKLCDFGLTKPEATYNSRSRFYARFLGTAGYAAPEYMSTGTLTAKCNVYSFGMILLEIVTGKPAICINEPSEDSDEWTRSLFPVSGHKSSLVLNPNILGQYSTTNVQKIAQLAFKCVFEDPSLRPDMTDVARVLEELQ